MTNTAYVHRLCMLQRCHALNTRHTLHIFHLHQIIQWLLKKTWHYKAWHGMTFSYITLQYHSCKHGMYYVHVNLCTYLPIYLAMLHASVPTLIHCKKYITRPYIKKSRRNLPNYVALHCIAPRNSAYFFLFHTLQCIHYKHYIHVMHATTACKQPTYQTKPYHYTRHKHYKHFKHYI